MHRTGGATDARQAGWTIWAHCKEGKPTRAAGPEGWLRIPSITLAPKKLIRTRRASEGSASEPSLARRVSMCKDTKLSCRGNNAECGMRN